MKDYSYKELCVFFNEEPTERKNHHNQFKRWRKKYDIEKRKDCNRYYIKEKTFSNQMKTTFKTKSYELLEPMLFYLLSIEEDKKIKTTYTKLQDKLGLVGANFFKSRYSKEQRLLIADNIGVSEEELLIFNNDVYDINKEMIRRMIYKMIDKGLIVKEDVLSVNFISNNGSIVERDISGEEYANILFERNKLSIKEYGKVYNSLKYEYKTIIDEKINELYKFVKCKNEFYLYLDKDSINYCLRKDFDYLLNRKITNETNQLRIMKSTRNNLKNFSKIKKTNLIDGVISLE